VAALVRVAATAALPKGVRFDEDAYKGAKDTVKKKLTDLGYAYATVDASATIDPGPRVVDYVFTVVPGPLAKFGKITIVGLDPDAAGPKPQEIDEAPLRRAINIDEGATYSTAEIDTATQALLELEVFSAVQIDPQLPQPPPADPVVPLIVRVEPTRLRQVRFGIGAEFDEIKTDLHLLAGWEDHNFLGGLRDLSIDLRPGVVLYPLRVGDIESPKHPLLEERLKLQFRQPSFLEAHTNAFVKPEFNVYPFLVAPNPEATAPVIGYVEAKGVAGVERRFGRLSVSLAYNTQLEFPFSYLQTLNANLSTIILSYPQLVTSLDFRDDPIHPHKGIFLSNDFQIAGGLFGGSARDVRIQPEARGYVPISRRVTLATRASVGFLFAESYPHDRNETFDHELDTLPSARGADLKADVRDLQIIYFRGFFSGGPNSNRGYPLRGIAPYGQVPFLLPQTAGQQVAAGCIPGSAGYNPAACGLPIAGFTLWEWSDELRFQVSGPFSVAAFCDAGDVSPQQAQIRMRYLHLSCGLGARYDTPVGPIRVDVGYRIPGLQILGQPSEAAAARLDPSNGLPPTFLGQPLAFSFGIGEAY
jgi:outer membrane translocation and assembly module TamA